jgi:hypothetical protein
MALGLMLEKLMNVCLNFLVILESFVQNCHFFLILVHQIRRIVQSMVIVGLNPHFLKDPVFSAHIEGIIMQMNTNQYLVFSLSHSIQNWLHVFLQTHSRQV